MVVPVFAAPGKDVVVVVVTAITSAAEEVGVTSSEAAEAEASFFSSEGVPLLVLVLLFVLEFGLLFGF